MLDAQALFRVREASNVGVKREPGGIGPRAVMPQISLNLRHWRLLFHQAQLVPQTQWIKVNKFGAYLVALH
jgi:hypothetical protein